MTDPRRHRRPRRPHAVSACLVVLAIVVSTGCVRRRLTVRSTPPGAIVHVDNQRIGTTPCSVDYVYYGTREIRLSLPGYETLTVNQPLPAPWYETPGIDFISENLVPARIEDARTVSFNLQRRRLEPAEEVIARGEQLRQQMTPVGAAPILPAGASLPVIPPPPAGDPFGALGPPAEGYAPSALSPGSPAPASPQPFRY